MKKIIPAAIFFLAGIASLSAQNFKLWGLTGTGGINENGTIFSYDPANPGISNCYNFLDNDSSGAQPKGTLMRATNGLLYGTAEQGGTGSGVIFSIDPLTHVYTNLYNFSANNVDANNPAGGGFIQATNGLLYGMADNGGANASAGAIFSFNPATNAYATLYSFGLTNCGSNPTGNLLQVPGGLMYGLAQFGGEGPNGRGAIFSFDPTNNTYTNLYGFTEDSSSGGVPAGNLIRASNGLLYGLTQYGGPNDFGVIFSFNPLTNTYTNLYNFTQDSFSGGHPGGSLVQATNGLLYGMTERGGMYGQPGVGNGVIFSFNPNTNVYTNLYSFAGGSNSGAGPNGSLIQAPDGFLYGMTYAGGANNTGVLFSFNPQNNTYANITSLNTATGDRPWGSLIAISGTNDIQPVELNSFNIKMYPNPFASTFQIELNNCDGENVDLVVFDILGRPVETKLHGSCTQTIEAGEKLSSGTYLVQIKQGNETKTCRIVKE